MILHLELMQIFSEYLTVYYILSKLEATGIKKHTLSLKPAQNKSKWCY